MHETGERTVMKISARNDLQGFVKAVKIGMVNAEVVVELGGKEKVVSIITNDALVRLGIKEGSRVSAIVKASSMLLAKQKIEGISARNQLCGKVAAVKSGAVNAEVSIVLEGGTRLTAIVTNEAADELGLKSGCDACALFKAGSVMLAV